MSDNPQLQLEVVLDDGSVKRFYGPLKAESEKSGKDVGQGFFKGFNSFSGSLSVAKIAGLGIAFEAMHSALSSLRAEFDRSITTYRQFSRGVAEINSILPDNEKLTNRSKDALVSFSRQFATDPQAQAKAYYNIVSAGVQGAYKQVNVLNQSNKAAVAGLVDINTSAVALVSSMNAYSVSGLTAAQASDSLFVAVREGQTTFGELATSIGRVAPLASSAGVQFSELTGYLAFLTKSGVQTAEAVTGVRAILAAVIKPSVEAAKYAEELGIQFNTAAIRSKGLAGFLKDVRIATNGSEAALAKLFPGVEALAPVVQTVNGDFDDLQRILNETAKAAGATDKAFAEIATNADFQAKQTEKAWNGWLVRMGSIFSDWSLTAKKYFLDVVGASADSMQEKVKSISEEVAKINRDLARGQQASLVGLNRGTTQSISEEEWRTQLEERKAELLKEQLRLRRELDPTYETEAEKQKRIADELERKQIALLESSQAEEEAFFRSQAEEERLRNAAAPIGLGTFFEEFSSGFSDNWDELNLADKEKRIVELKKSIQDFAKQSKTALMSGFASSMGNAFSAFGAALVNGENALGSFVDAFLASIGQQLVQQGTAFILQGIAWSVNPATIGSGAPLIAAGAAMAAFGGILGAVGGGAKGTASSPSGSYQAADGYIPDNYSTSNEALTALERAEPQTRVEINVQGSILGSDRDELALTLAELLNEAGVSNNVRFA